MPDHRTGDTCNLNQPGSAGSLGDGGGITRQLIDNRLTESGGNRPDLRVFEVGTDIEDSVVEIGKDGV